MFQDQLDITLLILSLLDSVSAFALIPRVCELFKAITKKYYFWKLLFYNESLLVLPEENKIIIDDINIKALIGVSLKRRDTMSIFYIDELNVSVIDDGRVDWGKCVMPEEITGDDLIRLAGLSNVILLSALKILLPVSICIDGLTSKHSKVRMQIMEIFLKDENFKCTYYFEGFKKFPEIITRNAESFLEQIYAIARQGNCFIESIKTNPLSSIGIVVGCEKIWLSSLFSQHTSRLGTSTVGVKRKYND